MFGDPIGLYPNNANVENVGSGGQNQSLYNEDGTLNLPNPIIPASGISMNAFNEWQRNNPIKNVTPEQEKVRESNTDETLGLNKGLFEFMKKGNPTGSNFGNSGFNLGSGSAPGSQFAGGIDTGMQVGSKLGIKGIFG